MRNAQLHSLADYIIPGEPLTPLAARVRYYTARILGDVASADYLLQGIAKADQKRALRIAYEATVSAPGCGVCNTCGAYIGIDTPATDAAFVEGREHCSRECPKKALRASMAYLSRPARRTEVTA